MDFYTFFKLLNEGGKMNCSSKLIFALKETHFVSYVRKLLIKL